MSSLKVETISNAEKKLLGIFTASEVGLYHNLLIEVVSESVKISLNGESIADAATFNAGDRVFVKNVKSVSFLRATASDASVRLTLTDSEVSFAAPNAVSLAANTLVSGKDAGPSQTIVRTYTTSANMTTAAALTNAPVSGQKILLLDALISSDANMIFDVEMETSGNVLAKFPLVAGNPPVQITLRGYLKGDAADKKLYGKASAAGNIYVTMIYTSEV